MIHKQYLQETGGKRLRFSQDERVLSCLTGAFLSDAKCTMAALITCVRIFTIFMMVTVRMTPGRARSKRMCTWLLTAVSFSNKESLTSWYQMTPLEIFSRALPLNLWHLSRFMAFWSMKTEMLAQLALRLDIICGNCRPSLSTKVSLVEIAGLVCRLAKNAEFPKEKPRENLASDREKTNTQKVLRGKDNSNIF